MLLYFFSGKLEFDSYRYKKFVPFKNSDQYKMISVQIKNN